MGTSAGSVTEINRKLPVIYDTSCGLMTGRCLIATTTQYAIRKVQEANLGLDMNGTHQVLACADDVNLTGNDIRLIERNADVLLNACKDIGLAVNTGKFKYM